MVGLLHLTASLCRRAIIKGRPQGSLCGPFIWNLMMYSLMLDLLERGLNCVAYADYLLLLVEESSWIAKERSGCGSGDCRWLGCLVAERKYQFGEGWLRTVRG